MAKVGIECCVCGVRTTRFVQAHRFGFGRKACGPCARVMAANPSLSREDILAIRMPPLGNPPSGRSFREAWGLSEGQEQLLGRGFTAVKTPPGALPPALRAELEGEELLTPLAELLASAMLQETQTEWGPLQHSSSADLGPCVDCGAPDAGYRVFQQVFLCDSCQARRDAQAPQSFACSVCATPVSGLTLCTGCFSHVCDACVGRFNATRPIGFHLPEDHPGPPRGARH